MVKATKAIKAKTQPVKKVKKTPAKKKQLPKPEEEEVVPLPATRKSDDPIPKKVLDCDIDDSIVRLIKSHLLCRKNGLTNNVFWCLLLGASIIVIVI